MLRQLTGSVATTAALALGIACSSAFGADGVGSASARAARSSANGSASAGAARHKPGAVVGRAEPRTAIVASATMLMGQNTVESQYDSLAAGQAEAFRLQALATGLAHDVDVYVGSADAARKVLVGLYSNGKGHPSTILSIGSAAITSTGAWVTVSVAPVEILAGRTYWLAVLGEGGRLRYRDRAHGPCSSETSSQTSLGALPGTWKTGTVYSDCPISAYVTAAGVALPVLPIEPVAPAPPVEPILPPTEPPTPVQEPTPPVQEPTPPVQEQEPVIVPPSPPANSSRPAIVGTARAGQVLEASSGSWSGTPTISYQWQDCNASGSACANVGGATAASYVLSALDVGSTVRMIVTASNAGGSAQAISAATGVVLPLAPVDSGLPAITGSTVEGQTLSVSTGSWSGSPTSYAYQWEDCSASGESCSAIAGATGSKRELVAADVGHTLRAVVKASNAGGTGEAQSSATSIVSAEHHEGPTVNCFENPETEGTSRLEACGYPGPNNTGAGGEGTAKCASYAKRSGGFTPEAGKTYEHLTIEGYVTISASNVTLRNDCIISGAGVETAVEVVSGTAGAGFKIIDSVVMGENTTTDAIEHALANYGSSEPEAVGDRLESCGECLAYSWNLKESYVISNGKVDTFGEGAKEVHFEDWYTSDGKLTAEHDTLFNPVKNTSTIFGDVDGGRGGPCQNDFTIVGDFLAGGGYTLGTCPNATGVGTSKMDIKDNRFARMQCKKGNVMENFEGRGGTACEGKLDCDEEWCTGNDGSGGFWPKGGFFGLIYNGPTDYFTGTGQVWEGNYWDDDAEEIPQP